MLTDRHANTQTDTTENNTSLAVRVVNTSHGPNQGQNDIGIGVLGIAQYFPVLDIGQYFYWLSYPIPILLGHLDISCQQGNWGGGKVKLESWQMKELEMEFGKQ